MSRAVTRLTYVLDFQLAGFASQTRTVNLGLAQVVTLDMKLGVAALQEAISVNASAAVLDLRPARSASTCRPTNCSICP